MNEFTTMKYDDDVSIIALKKNLWLVYCLIYLPVTTYFNFIWFIIFFG
jgi:hypothetical protein